MKNLADVICIVITTKKTYLIVSKRVVCIHKHYVYVHLYVHVCVNTFNYYGCGMVIPGLIISLQSLLICPPTKFKLCSIE